jgi:hypothetical protein
MEYNDSTAAEVNRQPAAPFFLPQWLWAGLGVCPEGAAGANCHILAPACTPPAGRALNAFNRSGNGDT